MSATIVWTAKGTSSLLSQTRWLKENVGEEYAERRASSWYQAIERLAEHPTKGTLTYVRTGVRRWKLDKHNYVLYKPIPGGISVLLIGSYKARRKPF